MVWSLRHLWLSLAVSAVCLSACSGSSTSNASRIDNPALSEQGSAIVQGKLEKGFSGVGALTLTVAGYGYAGSFCTGTLIADQWVLTAAHCLMEYSDIKVTPRMVSFFIGQDANPNGFSKPTGSFYQADAFYVHEAYTSSAHRGDVALVHLNKVVAPEVTRYAYARESYLFPNASVTYVGYGCTEGLQQTGSGIKRSAVIPVASVFNQTYQSKFIGSGVCFGDSGGPGLFPRPDGSYVAVGINSTTGGAIPGTDPCKTGGYHTAVFYYHPWITGKLTGTQPSCKSDPKICVCDTACQGDGSCNNDLCQTSSCRDVYLCFSQCDPVDQDCAMGCYQNGTAQAQGQVDSMSQCLAKHCTPAQEGDPVDQACIEKFCKAEVNACFPVVTGEQSCEQVYGCISQCGKDDAKCQQNCFDTGTKEAQDALVGLFGCFDEKCASITDDAQWKECVNIQCLDKINACFPPENNPPPADSTGTTPVQPATPAPTP